MDASVADVFAAITDILAAVADVLSPVETIFAEVANLLTAVEGDAGRGMGGVAGLGLGRDRENHDGGQEKNEAHGNGGNVGV